MLFVGVGAVSLPYAERRGVSALAAEPMLAEEGSVAWMAERRMAPSRRSAAITYIDAPPPLPQLTSSWGQSINLLAQEPARGAGVSCLSPNKEMQTDEGCALVCEKNMSSPKDY